METTAQMPDLNLRARLGAVVHTEAGSKIDHTYNLGIRNMRVVAQWNECERKPGEYDFARVRACLSKIASKTPVKPYVTTFLTPAWIAPDVRPRGDKNAPHVPFLPASKIDRWQEYMTRLMDVLKEYGIEFVGFDCETNVNGTWKTRKEKPNDTEGALTSPEEFATNVILPVSDIVRKAGAKVVAPGITIQKYESEQHYARAIDHMIRIVNIARHDIDRVAVHSYGKSAEHVIEQIEDYTKRCAIRQMGVWVTECGFGEEWEWLSDNLGQSLLELFQSGQQRQLNRYQKLIPYADRTNWIHRWYLYRAFDIKGDPERKHTAGLLNWRLRAKLAGRYIQETLRNES